MQPQKDSFALGLNLVPFYVVLRPQKEFLLWKNEVLIHQNLKKKKQPTKLVQTRTPLLFWAVFFMKQGMAL